MGCVDFSVFSLNEIKNKGFVYSEKYGPPLFRESYGCNKFSSFIGSWDGVEKMEKLFNYNMYLFG